MGDYSITCHIGAESKFFSNRNNHETQLTAKYVTVN